MPRPAKPFIYRDHYVTYAGGLTTPLKLCHVDDGEAVAQERLDEYLVGLRRHGRTTNPNLRVAELVALFLDAKKVDKAPATYAYYQRWLTEVAKFFGNRPARDVTNREALAFRDDLARRTYDPARVTTGTARKTPAAGRKPYKPKTINHAIIAAKACWGWGVKFHYLPAGTNPFTAVPLLHTEDRERVLTDAEFQALLRHSTDAAFRQVLLAFRYTSARPGEVRGLKWSQVDWDRSVAIIRQHKTSRTTKKKNKKARMITLSPCVLALLRYLQRRHGHQPYCFLNSEGRPWTKDALVQRMQSLRERAGIAPDDNGEQVVLYTNRHTFITNAAKAGVSGPVLQHLAGHTDPATTERYVHLAAADLLKAGQRAADFMRPVKPGK